MAALAVALDGPITRRTQILRLYAFLGRYGRQPIDALGRVPVSLLEELAREVGYLIRDESVTVEGGA